MTGFINVNKACGVSSAREVGRIKKLLNTPCGHMGTLDPLATGVLPVAVGNAARLFDYFLDKRKTYVAVFDFGIDSDTLDVTGNMTERFGRIPSEDEILSVLGEFVGEINQIPPKYSAKNISGKRGYELARAGVEFELPPKKVNIYSVKLIKKCSDTGFAFEIECGGGTYIRSIARDLAKRLNTVAIMNSLVRTKSGIFSVDTAVETDRLTAENIKDFLIPTETVLPFGSYTPDVKTAKKLFNGLSAECSLADGTYKIFTPEGSFYGLAEVGKSYIKVRTKLC